MKLQILQENFEKALNTASRFVSAKAQLPVLGNILLTADKSKLSIASTNLEISISIGVGAKIEEEGEISIPSKVLTELVANLPSETITLESEKEQMKVSASSFTSNVLGMNSSDFPKIPNTISKEKALSLPKKDFAEGLSQVLFAASSDETRPVLTGVLLVWGKNELSLVATDGFRLSQKKIKLPNPNSEAKIILPKLILAEVSRMAGEESEELLFSLHDKEKQVLFGISEMVLTSRLIEGEYPDFEKIIPKNPTLNVSVDKEDLLRAVKLASIFAREAANVVKLKIMKESVKILAESGQSGSQETKVEARIEGGTGDFEISFNYRFLEDFLHSVSGDEVKMEFSTVTAAGIFTDPKDSSYLHLIMPVRVQG
jgi:DNA polymerase-3 subunit beta